MISKNEIKSIKALQQKKFRDEMGVFVAEGEKVVEEVLASSWRIKEVYATDVWEAKIDFTRISPSEMERLSSLKTAPSVLALVYKPEPEELNSNGLTVALDGVRDPGNLGTIIRSAVWFGAKRILLSDDCVDIFNPKVVRATMGAMFKVPIHAGNLVELLSKVDAPKVGMILGGTDGVGALHNEDLVVVYGNEGQGIRPGITGILDYQVELPGIGNMESLNVAMSVSVSLYERFRGLSGE